MNYKDIKEFNQRCEEHPDHQSGMISYGMISQRLQEEIDGRLNMKLLSLMMKKILMKKKSHL